MGNVSSVPRRIAKTAGYCLAAAAALWSIGTFVDYQMSLAVVHPTDGTLGIAQAEGSGRAIRVTEGAKCRVVGIVSNESCQGQHHPED